MLMMWEFAGHNLVAEVGLSFATGLYAVYNYVSGESVQVTALFITFFFFAKKR
jgi:hypothetical protein